MGEFQYTAKNAQGENVTGVVSADNEAAVLRVLDEKNLFPVSVSDAAGAARRKQKTAKRRISSRDVGVMYGQLADLIGSGVPLLRALDSLIKSTVNARLRDVLKEIRASVADGQSLTAAMREHPRVFPALHTAMVQAGERASFLEDVLRSLSHFLERLDELRSKVLGAMIYPALLTVVGLAVMIGALIFFVPRFEPLLSGVHQSFPTRLLFALSHAVRGFWYLILMGMGGAGGLLWSGLKSETGKRWIEEWRLKLPVVGTALRMVAITRFCRILGTMLANGVPLLQALSISKDSTGSPLLADRVGEAAENVRAGKPLTEPLRAGGLFPEQIIAMITVAEESNQLEKVLLHIADTVERRTNRQVDQAVRLVEPLILCGVAAAIGFLALGLLLPIFTMASTLTVK
ncbi:MAG: type II secretion system F family protein [Verrucomicrobia bacterium]|nr:type II secretion system F family protein [Verrucomicrobiota bacterium]